MPVSYHDLPEEEQKRIIEKCAKGANEDQRELIRKYPILFCTANPILEMRKMRFYKYHNFGAFIRVRLSVILHDIARFLDKISNKLSDTK